MVTHPKVSRAPARTKVLNPITTTLLRLGLRPDPRMALLTVRGRKSGRDCTVPMGVFDRDGHTYVVAAFGEVNWVLNLRAARTATVTQGKRSATYSAEQVHGEEAALVLRECLAAYRPSPLAGPMLRQRIHVSADASLEVLALEAQRTPVFRLTELTAATTA
ncbi:MAG: nitroreductase family deazaflavin-dependent oxidoreductase [Chloroflexi bacterium]|nr:nitroreductase family deazaflavin-dependent oxidoreductase [Chloroflexota bacterium]MBV9602855.1 nitroreductase family deazaflavin-dependent oxidoreductase [Chloroflexota bacterium]